MRLAVFLAVALGALRPSVADVRCIDAARELARLAARGEPDRGRAVAAALAPTGARIELVQDGDTVTARSRARSAPVATPVRRAAVAAGGGRGRAESAVLESRDPWSAVNGDRRSVRRAEAGSPRCGPPPRWPCS